MNCEATLRHLPFYVYGELEFDEEERVAQHLETCASCRTELKSMELMHGALGCSELEPDAQLLTDNRRALRLQVAQLAEAGVGGSRAARWFNVASLGWRRLIQPAGALALIAAGFFGGRMLPGESVEPSRAFQPIASRVRYIEPNNNSGQVQIVLEETRERVLSGDMNEEPIRRLLLAAARDSDDPGVRVETMDLLKSHSQSADVRRALLHALQHDPNAGVRLKALDGLRDFADEQETREVLSVVLLSDQNPGVRTQAIDLLTQRREPKMVGVLQELMTREDNNYVRLKCQKALSDMNASVETF